MNKLYLSLLFCSSIFAKDLVNWDYTHEFHLKKDKVAKVEIVKKEYDSQSPLDGKLSFRWTLFHNKRLVLLVNYEGYPTQYVLEKVYKRDSVAINLLGDYEQLNQKVTLKLKFSEFAKNEATIEALVYDPKKRVEVEFIDPKRER